MDELVSRDLAALWHPATHFADHEVLPPIPIERARGVWLHATDGRRILDAISSWWTCIHGHGHPAIVAAVARQVAELDHVLFAGFTHAPAIALAESLLRRATPGFSRVFFADCGSAAVEAAMKLSFQFRRQTGEPARGRFAALRNGYHGETLGALALGDLGEYKRAFEPMLVDVLRLPTPSHPDHRHDDLAGDLGADAPETEAAVELVHRHAHELTAIVLEPLVQCAAGMTMPGAGYCRRVVEAARGHGIHVIADEIAVAFGRTGRLFAGEWFGLRPDVLCLGKGLGAGILPLSCLLVGPELEAAFHGAPERSFLHSHTYTANPIACAAGVASLALFDQVGVLERVRETIGQLDRLRRQVAGRAPTVAHHRQAGTIVAFDLDRVPDDPEAARAFRRRLRGAALERGLLLRPLGRTVYWMPPLSIDPGELDVLAERTIAALNAVAEPS